MGMGGSESGSAPLFPLSRWREGYKCVEVDEFVHRLRVAAAGEISAREVREVRFTPERWAKPGYDLVAVDAYLDAVAARVEAGGSPDSIPVARTGRLSVSRRTCQRRFRMVTPDDVRDQLSRLGKVAA